MLRLHVLVDYVQRQQRSRWFPIRGTEHGGSLSAVLHLAVELYRSGLRLIQLLLGDHDERIGADKERIGA